MTARLNRFLAPPTAAGSTSRRRPHVLRRGRVSRRDREHGADGRDARPGGVGCDPALPGQGRFCEERPGHGRRSSCAWTCANVYGPEHPGHLPSELVERAVEQALILDAACVVVNILSFRASRKLLHQCIRNVTALRAACGPVGMPPMVEPLVFKPGERGYGLGRRSEEDHAARPPSRRARRRHHQGRPDRRPRRLPARARGVVARGRCSFAAAVARPKRDPSSARAR